MPAALFGEYPLVTLARKTLLPFLLGCYCCFMGAFKVIGPSEMPWFQLNCRELPTHAILSAWSKDPRLMARAGFSLGLYYLFCIPVYSLSMSVAVLLAEERLLALAWTGLEEGWFWCAGSSA